MVENVATTELLGEFETHYKELLRFLVLRIGDPDRAADVAQDVWLKVASVRHLSDVIDNPRTYLFRVAANLAMDTARHDGRLAQRHADESLAQQVPDPLTCPERHVLARERLDALNVALAGISDNSPAATLDPSRHSRRRSGGLVCRHGGC